MTRLTATVAARTPGDPTESPTSGAVDGPQLIARLRARATATPPDGSDALPVGAPPAAGFVSDAGEVVLWRGGQPVTVARVGITHLFRALETAYGTLLAQPGTPLILVRPDGTVTTLGTGHAAPFPALSEDGRQVAITESHVGRSSWYRVDIHDLADGTFKTLPWDENRMLGAAFLHRGVVYGAGETSTGPPGHATRFRWPLGGEPEPIDVVIRQIDPLTGTWLADDFATDQLLVIGPDGARRPVNPTRGPLLIPGAGSVVRFHHAPPTIEVLDLAGGPGRSYRLPSQSRVSTTTPGGPVWEDARHVLIGFDTLDYRLQARAIRIDTTTGAIEEIQLTDNAGYGPTLIRPLLRQ